MEGENLFSLFRRVLRYSHPRWQPLFSEKNYLCLNFFWRIFRFWQNWGTFFCSRISLIVTLMCQELQLELFDLKANDLLNEKQREWKLVEFYHRLSDVEFPKMKKFGAGMASVHNNLCLSKRFQNWCKVNRSNDIDERKISMIGLKLLHPNVSFTNLADRFCLVCEIWICNFLLKLPSFINF